MEWLIDLAISVLSRRKRGRREVEKSQAPFVSFADTSSSGGRGCRARRAANSLEQHFLFCSGLFSGGAACPCACAVTCGGE